jgi:L-threonylcarbamoyladenylate synthase
MIDFSSDIENALEVLKEGGTILYPTDTVWGIGCDATSEEAVEKIFNIKERPQEKSMIILVADEREVMQYVSQLDLEVFNYLEQMPKPTTVIYEGAIGLASNLVGSDGSIAIRIVKENFCKHLIKRLRKPLVSTSANRSGDPPPANFQQVSEGIRSAVDYVVNYRQDDAAKAQPSAVIRWNRNGTATVIRP